MDIAIRPNEAESATWQTPISHRMPTATDGDQRGNVQVLYDDGWAICHWVDVHEPRWQHTKNWKSLDCQSPLGRLERIQQLIDDLRNSLLFAP